MTAADGASGAPAADQAVPPPAETPYRGLAPFAEGDFDYFFGRNKDTARIAASTITEALAVLFGPSGVGKSSVLGAALPPAIDRIIEGTLVVPFFRWEAGFYPTLIGRARRLAGLSHGEGATTLEAIAETWIETHATPIVFIFDQFEQYFLIPRVDGERDDGIDAAFEIDLARTINRRDLDTHVLISIREDALYELDRLRGRLPCILSDPIRLDYIDAKSAELAIREPLRVYRERHGDAQGPVAIEDALANELLARARRVAEPTQYETPYLQLVLERLWNEERRLGSAVLRHETYERLHGWEGIATSHVRHTLETVLVEDDRAVCAALFDRMVTPSGMKITLAADDLAAMTEAEPERVEAILTTLGHPDSRIIRSVAPAHDSGRRRYEIFHDVLARPILAWKHAFNAEREQRHLREEAEREQERLRAEAEADRIRQQREIDAQTRRATAQRRIAKRFQRISMAATALAILALLFAAWAGYSYRQAAKQRAQVLAMRADLATMSGDSRQGLLLALEALPKDSGLGEWFRRPTIDAATSALERVLFRPIGYTLNGHAGDLVHVAYSPDGKNILTAADDQTVKIWRVREGMAPDLRLVLQHRAPPSSAQFSRDGRFVITASEAGRAYIWDADSGAELTQWQVGAARPTIVELSPDNRQIVAVVYGADASLWSWDPEQVLDPGGTQAPPKQVTDLRDADKPTHNWGTSFVAFDPTGTHVLTASWSGDARIWDARTAQLVKTLARASGDAQGRCLATASGHCGPVVAAAFDPVRPKRVVTASLDKTARIWDLSTGTVTTSLVGHSRSVTSASFSDNGERVITASLDGTVRVWNAMTGEMLQILQGPGAVAGQKASAQLDRDLSHVLAAFSGPQAFIWDLRSDLAPLVLPPLGDVVPTAALDAGDSVLITGTGLAVGIHDPTTGARLGDPAFLDGAVMAVAANPTGLDVIAAAGKAVEIFDVGRWRETGEPPPPRQLATHDNLVLAVAYDAAGQRVATASQDGTARIWTATDGSPVGEPLRHNGAVFSASFDRAGKRVLTGSFDKTVRIWDAKDGKALRVIPTGEPVVDAVFTADGRHIVVTTLDLAEAPVTKPPFFQTSTAIWDSEAGVRLDGRDRAALKDVKFLQLDHLVVVGTGDGVVRLGNALDADPVAVLPSHRSSVKRVTASPSGERLATISADGSVRIWRLPPAEPHALVAYANTIADRHLDPAQRRLSPEERESFGLVEANETLAKTLRGWVRATWQAMDPL